VTRKQFVAAASLLVALSFGLTWSIESRLYSEQVFNQYDVWFETDANYYLAAFSNGQGFLLARHPSLVETVHPVVSLSAKILATIGVGGSEASLRQSLALLVVPLVAAGRTLIMLTLFHQLLGRLYPTILLCVVDIFAASAVTVCAVPETYGFTALYLAVAFWLTLDDRPRRRYFNNIAWLIVSSLAIGALLSNAVSIAILATVSLIRRGSSFIRTIPRVAALIASALALNAIVVGVSAWSVGSAGYRPGLNTPVFAKEFVHSPSLAASTGIAWAMAHTFLAPSPGTEPLMIPRRPDDRYDFIFSYAPPYQHGWASGWRAGATLVVLGLGVVGFARRRTLQPVLIGVAGMLAFNFLIHQFYGLHYNLYAGHWEPALLVVASGAALLPRRLAAVGTVALSAFTLLTIVSSLALLNYTFTYLSNH
jgi:hypothetical protein